MTSSGLEPTTFRLVAQSILEVSETEFCLRLQVEPTQIETEFSLRNVVLLNRRWDDE
jgi:hypothetical protein